MKLLHNSIHLNTVSYSLYQIYASKGWTVLWVWLFQKLVSHELSKIEAVANPNLDNELFLREISIQKYGIIHRI